VKHAALIYYGGERISTSLKFLRPWLLLLLTKVDRREGKTLGNEEDRVVGNGLFGYVRRN